MYEAMSREGNRAEARLDERQRSNTSVSVVDAPDKRDYDRVISKRRVVAMIFAIYSRYTYTAAYEQMAVCSITMGSPGFARFYADLTDK